LNSSPATNGPTGPHGAIKSSPVHDFRERLAWSEEAGDEPFWDRIYRKAFPNLVNHMQTSGDTVSQRMGIDRLIMLANGHTLRIDEKKREQDWPDILLEYLSNDQTNAPGWMNKDLAIDYLAYAFMPSQRVYLFPWPLLRRAWLEFGDQWIEQYETKIARNSGYNTHSVAIPTNVLTQTVQRAMIIELQPA